MAHIEKTLPPAMLSRGDLARELRVSRATTYRYQHEGYLPAPLRIGPGVLRWRREDIDRLLERLAADRGETP